MKQQNYRSLLAAALAAGVIYVPAPVAVAEEMSIEEIIVTATRVESALQDTAIAVSAFTGDIMDDMNISSGMDYEAVVPSLSIQLSPNRTSIRGVGRFDNRLGIAPGVALYNDGAYLQENTALGSNWMNTDRVEIMRGPQGTLFGRNTTGGATNVLKRKPKDYFELDLLLGAGNYGSQNFEMFIGGPLTDTIRSKLYYNTWESDGPWKNRGATDARSGTVDRNYYAELIFDWKPSDALFLMWKIEHLFTSYATGGTSYMDGYDPFNVCTSILNWCHTGYDQLQAGIDEPLDPRTVDVNSVGETSTDHHVSHTFTAIYDFENAQVKYIGHYNRYDWFSFGTDFDGTSNPDHGVIEDIQQNQRFMSHEVIFNSASDSPLQWVAGAYYMNDENWQPYTWRDMGTNTDMANIVDYDRMLEGGGGTAPLTTADIIGQNPELLYFRYDATFWNENWSVFSEFNYAFSETWKLTMGARYSVDDLKAREQEWVYGDSYVFISPAWWDGWCPWVPILVPGEECVTRGALNYTRSPVPRTTTESFKDTSGRVILEYTPNDDSLYWLTISNAFKVGGIMSGALQGIETGASPYFDGEEVTMYELGWKGTIGNTFQLELIAFNYDYKGMQQIRSFRNSLGLTFARVENIDSAMYGVEAQAQWLATERLMLMFTYSYNHAEFDEHMLFAEHEIELHCDATNAQGDCLIDIYGNKLDITPDTKLSVNALYTFNTGVGEITLGGTWSYVGERYFDIFNSPEIKGDAYKRLDLSATWTSDSGKWQVRGWVKNATDELWYNTRSIGANDNPDNSSYGWYGSTKYLRRSGNPADPRLYQFELRYRI